MTKTIGIDFGDCFFRLSHLDGRIPKIIADDSGRTGFPSKVSFLPGGRCRVGFDAEMFGIPEDTVLHPMTLVGKSASELLALNGRYAHEIIQERNWILINANRVFVSVDEVLIALFAHIKELAEKSLRAKVESAVIATGTAVTASLDTILLDLMATHPYSKN